MDVMAPFEANAAVFMFAQSKRHKGQAEGNWVGDEF
jgi:hypothetical protein